MRSRFTCSLNASVADSRLNSPSEFLTLLSSLSAAHTIWQKLRSISACRSVPGSLSLRIPHGPVLAFIQCDSKCSVSMCTVVKLSNPLVPIVFTVRCSPARCSIVMFFRYSTRSPSGALKSCVTSSYAMSRPHVKSMPATQGDEEVSFVLPKSVWVAVSAPPFIPLLAVLCCAPSCTQPLHRSRLRRLARIDLPIPANGALTVMEIVGKPMRSDVDCRTADYVRVLKV